MTYVMKKAPRMVVHGELETEDGVFESEYAWYGSDDDPEDIWRDMNERVDERLARDASQAARLRYLLRLEAMSGNGGVQ